MGVLDAVASQLAHVGQVQPDPHQGMTHPGSGRIPTSQDAHQAVMDAMRHMYEPDAIRNQEPGLEAPSIGPISLDPTDYMGPGAYKAIGKAALHAIVHGAELSGLPVTMSAVKPESRNWFSPALNDYIGNLAPDAAAGRGWVPEGGVEALGQAHPAVSKWITTQLPRYLKTYLGTAEDPLLQVEKEGNLHIPEMNQLRFNELYRPAGEGGAETTPGFVRPNSVHAQLTGRKIRTPWERLSDAQVSSQPVGEMLHDFKDLMGANEFHPPYPGDTDTSEFDLRRSTIPEHKQFSWAETADPSTPVWDISFHPLDDPLQFGHVKDYLQHAVTTHAENPADPLALNPASLPQLSVADAVRKTAAWDRANAAQAQSAKLAALKDQPGKDYHDGWRWSTLQGTEDADLASQVGEGNGWSFSSKSKAEDYLGKGSKLHVLTDPEGKPLATVEEGEEAVWNKALPEPNPPSLLQIKGRFNGMPDDAALPYVQDLVKHGIDDSQQAGEGWGRVSDLCHTGLVKHPTQGYVIKPDPNDTAAIRKFYGVHPEGYAPPDQVPVAPDEPAMASGGRVQDPHAQLRDILDNFFLTSIGV